MDTTRLILIICFAFVTMKLWTSWEMRYSPARDEAGRPPAISGAEDDAPRAGPGEVPVLPGGSDALEPSVVETVGTPASGAEVSVRTDVFDIRIDLQGAGIHRAALLDYPVDKNHPEDPFVLMEDAPGRVYITQGGLLSRQPAPTHEDSFRSPRDRYELAEGERTLVVPFTWTGDGITVTKTFEFERGNHLIKVRYRISNGADTGWSGRSYTQFKRSEPDDGGMRFIYTYTGAVISGPENRYEKISFGDISERALARDIENGWIAMIQHYFVTALVPSEQDASYHYYTRDLGNGLYAAGSITPAATAAPGQETEFVHQIYIGPKDQDRLAAIAPGLDLTVDYGMLWFLSKPLFWCLSKIHEYTGNWGWSIILVTVLLKLLFYRLSAAGYRSMAKMRRVQPRMLAIRERYKDDRMRMNQSMMQLYKEEKINPFGGCFPILIQIPVFIALYWVLLESIELRQAGFVLWIDDLSAPDPYWVLPIIMGVTMYIQQKLNPAPVDPVQAKVMMVLPFVFTVFFGFFPSGLVLYWVANNALSILQQWRITQNLEKAGLGARQK